MDEEIEKDGRKRKEDGRKRMEDRKKDRKMEG